jgi:CheY-like chemotaxis protein
MSAEQIGRLFRPFHQVENSLTKSHEGTGLGLSISNTLAVLMGGTINVSSRRGIGSEFVLRLPFEIYSSAVHREQGADVAPLPRGRRLIGVRVLVADDVPINRTVVVALLEGEGARVSTAANGAEAVDAIVQCADEGFDVVLMDLEMPIMDGRQATRRIRGLHVAVPIIGLTAHASVEERKDSLASGMNDQLVKPVMQDVLVRAIRRCIKEREPAAGVR